MLRIKPPNLDACILKIGPHFSTRILDYPQHTRAIAPVSYNVLNVWRRYAFAILTVHERFSDSRRAYIRLCRDMSAALDMPEQELADVLKASGITLYNQKADRLRRFTRVYLQNPGRFVCQPGETPRALRDRLLAEIDTLPGLGIAKLSFAVGVLYPAAANTVACVDTWMVRIFTDSPAKGGVRAVDYHVFESAMSWYAQRYNVSTFEVQWYLWDTIRNPGRVEDHSFLADTFTGWTV